ncbi:MAG: V-type ATP synthase subunit F [Oscillospiraceae bacterium]|nr:MAG: V-type ATP synthase subunit F [Oscillospiraceae bacterium]
MYKAAVIGDRQSVMGFRALGLTVECAETPVQAADALHRLAQTGHAVIYITEQLAGQIPQDIARYLDLPQVAVIPIPSKDGVLGIGDRELHQAVERAVGADILRSPDED